MALKSFLGHFLGRASRGAKGHPQALEPSSSSRAILGLARTASCPHFLHFRPTLPPRSLDEAILGLWGGPRSRGRDEEPAERPIGLRSAQRAMEAKRKELPRTGDRLTTTTASLLVRWVGSCHGLAPFFFLAAF